MKNQHTVVTDASLFTKFSAFVKAQILKHTKGRCGNVRWNHGKVWIMPHEYYGENGACIVDCSHTLALTMCKTEIHEEETDQPHVFAYRVKTLTFRPVGRFTGAVMGFANQDSLMEWAEQLEKVHGSQLRITGFHPLLNGLEVV